MTLGGSFSVRTADGVPVVDCEGEIDLTNIHEMRAVMNRASAGSDGDVLVVSLIGVKYLDSQGVRVLFEIAERLATTRRRLLVVAPSGTAPRRILQIVGAEAVCPVFDSVEAAVGSLSRGTSSP